MIWIDDAPCIGKLNIFFPEEENDETVAPARLICADCPNRIVCIDASLDEEFGVWGGLAAWERKPLQARLSREFRKLIPTIGPAVDTVARNLNESMAGVF